MALQDIHVNVPMDLKGNSVKLPWVHIISNLLHVLKFYLFFYFCSKQFVVFFFVFFFIYKILYHL